MSLAAAAALIAAALLIAACDESQSSVEVDVKPPQIASEGPILTQSQWRRSVSEICREASERVGAASAALTEKLTAEPASLTEAEISRSAYELSRPVIEDHLKQLAQLRPPSPKLDSYQQFLALLARELELSGRIALLLGEDGAEEELREADAGLGKAAVAASRFVKQERLWGCAGAAPHG